MALVLPGHAIVELDADSPPYPHDVPPLTLGIAPVVFSADKFQIGRPDPENEDSIRDLRRQHGKTHAFRFDEHQLRRWLSRSRTILRRYRPLICLGRRDRLLATALQELSVHTPDERLASRPADVKKAGGGAAALSRDDA